LINRFQWNMNKQIKQSLRYFDKLSFFVIELLLEILADKIRSHCLFLHTNVFDKSWDASFGIRGNDINAISHSAWYLLQHEPTNNKVNTDSFFVIRDSFSVSDALATHQNLHFQKIKINVQLLSFLIKTPPLFFYFIIPVNDTLNAQYFSWIYYHDLLRDGIYDLQRIIELLNDFSILIVTVKYFLTFYIHHEILKFFHTARDIALSSALNDSKLIIEFTMDFNIFISSTSLPIILRVQLHNRFYFVS